MRVRALVYSNSYLLLGLNAEGEYSLPGGSINPGESPIDALYRELAEETSIKTVQSIAHVFDYCENVVYRVDVSGLNPINPTLDPDQEFLTLGWYRRDRLPLRLSELTADVLAEEKKIGLVTAENHPPLTIQEGFKTQQHGLKLKIWAKNHPDLKDFEAEIDPTTKTATVKHIAFDDGKKALPWLEWFEMLAAEKSCLRALANVSEEELPFWTTAGYEIQCNGPLEDYTVYKTLYRREALSALDVYINDEKVLSLEDDEIFETLPGLAQKQASGDKIRFVKSQS